MLARTYLLEAAGREMHVMGPLGSTFKSLDAHRDSGSSQMH